MNQLSLNVINLFFLKLSDIRDIIRASQTCRQWRKAFQKHIDKYKFDLRPYHYKLRNRDLVHLKGCKHIILPSTITDKGIKYLYVKNQPLHTIELYNSSITDACFKYLSGVKNIILYDCLYITDKGLKYLSGVESISINHCYGITHFGYQYLRGIKSAHFQGYDVTNEKLIALFSNNPIIEQYPPSFTEKIKALFKPDPQQEITASSQYDCLSFRFCNSLSSAPFKYIKNVHTLEFYHCDNITDDHIAHIEGIKKIKLSGCKLITDKTLANLTETEDVDLEECANISDKGLWYLGKARRINLQSCILITDSGLHNLKSVEHLNILGCNNITEDGVKYIGSQLKSIKVSLAKITKDGLECVKGINDIELQLHLLTSNIRFIHLKDCKKLNLYIHTISKKNSDNELKHLSNIPILSIHLKYFPVTDFGLSHLSNAKKVSLECCRLITDDGMAYLKNVNEIEIMRCKLITDITLSHFMDTHTIKMDEFRSNSTSFTAKKNEIIMHP